MRIHPALKAAKRELRKAGIDTHYVGSLAMHVVCREWNPRPLIVDIKLSSHDDHLAKIDVCYLYDQHSMYAQVSKLHGHVFTY